VKLWSVQCRAQLLGVTRSWVYQHQDEPPSRGTGQGLGRSSAWDRADLRAYLLRDKEQPHDLHAARQIG
jgi:predicted DNA-binding transcriptional regulator AlpA